MTEPFVPSWAEQALARPSAFDIAENIALKDFFDAWQHLHSLPNDKLHRRQAEEAAQDLVSKAQLVKRMRDARPINGSPS